MINKIRRTPSMLSAQAVAAAGRRPNMQPVRMAGRAGARPFVAPVQYTSPAAASPFNQAPAYADEPADFSGPDPDVNTSSPSVPLWQRMAVVAVLVALGAGVFFYLAGPKKPPSYAPDVTVRRGADGKFDVRADEFLGSNAPVYADLVNIGKGLRIHFEPIDEGRNREDFEYDLKPAPEADPPAGQRREAVDEARRALAARITQLNSLKQRFIIVADYTDGVDRGLKSQLESRLNADRIQEMGKQGYEVSVLAHRVGASPSFNVLEPVTIPPGAVRGTGQQQLEDMRARLLGGAAEERYSAIATGLFNFLHEDAVRAGDHVLVLSDGIENDPNTVSFEPGPRNKWSDPRLLANEANWPEIEARMIQATPAVPELKGVVIDWYLPPAQPDKTRRMNAAIKIWKHLLERHGAVFQWHM